jgi:hypothetical protein
MTRLAAASRLPGAAASSSLHILHEAKVQDLLANVASDLPRFEASGVVAIDRMLWVIFDNSPMIARIHPTLSPGHPETQVFYPTGDLGYEDIAFDHVDGRYYVLVEAVPTGAGYSARVREFAGDFAPLRVRSLDFSLPSPNKGMEGLTCVRRNGRVHLLAMCEGNNCLDGRAGRRPGGGRVHVFVEDGDRWRRIETIRLPASLPFTDYSSVSVRGERIAVVSQESSALWVGWLSSSTWDVADDGAIYMFPRTQRGQIRYANVEGVCPGWTIRRLAVVPTTPARASRTDTSDWISRSTSLFCHRPPSPAPHVLVASRFRRQPRGRAGSVMMTARRHRRMPCSSSA